jgi:Mg2+-importing ATPase
MASLPLEGSVDEGLVGLARPPIVHTGCGPGSQRSGARRPVTVGVRLGFATRVSRGDLSGNTLFPAWVGVRPEKEPHIDRPSRTDTPRRRMAGDRGGHAELAPAAAVDDAFWAVPADVVLDRLATSEAGLSGEEARRRRERFGPNRLTPPRRGGWAALLARQFVDPIPLILLFAVLVAVVAGDLTDGLIILAIVVLSGFLGFWQEHRAGLAVQRLLALVQVHTDVRRDGTVVEVPPADVVPGEIIVLGAGDIIPCDCRLLRGDDLQVDDAALTGETFPRHKHPDPAPADAPLAERHSALLLGSHVVSGRGEAVSVATGARTELGRLTHRLEQRAPRTGFEQGIARFGLMLARVTAVLTAAILVVNLVLGRPIVDSLLFSLALAVGLTPQMLPAIVAVSLSAGARRMARQRVIVRRLDAIQDFGAMDVLCTDKTGTLTQGAVRLHAALDPAGRESPPVAALAAVNAGLQTGFSNPIDAAILAAHPADPRYRAADELPFSFTRKRLSVLVDGPDGRQLLTKGAFSPVLDVCASVAGPDGTVPLDGPRRDELGSRYRNLSDAGYRVLAVARRDLPGVPEVTAADERELTFLGFLVLLDPPKADAGRICEELTAVGIGLRMITGDNRLAAAHVAGAVGLDATRVLTGADLDRLDDQELAASIRGVQVFAEVDPLNKERIVQALRRGGATVGYLGDGINDAGALHLADVGISVDSAVDVAKSAAAIVLLDKDLGVLADGVRLGRQTFANTLKYVFTTVSANFGNMASMAAASAFLPFLPLLPRQILVLNFLSDIPSTTIAADSVDAEQRQRPQRWDLRFVRDFMLVFGLLSSAFDLLTFALLLQLFHAGPALFRTGWFVGSTLTELAVLLVLRTRRPAVRSRPGTGLLVSSIAVAAVTIALPYLPRLAGLLGLIPLPAAVLAALATITLLYVVSAEIAKRVFYRAIEHPADRRSMGGPSRRLARVAREHGGEPAPGR